LDDASIPPRRTNQILDGIFGRDNYPLADGQGLVYFIIRRRTPNQAFFDLRKLIRFSNLTCSNWRSTLHTVVLETGHRASSASS